MGAHVASSPATGRLVVRRATPEDGATRCALFAAVNMEADVVLSVRREPDFDLLYRLQSASWDSWVVELDGRVEAMGTVLVREGYVGGERCRVGYLGDLRISRRGQGRFLLDRLYRSLLEEAASLYACDLFLTAILASNARALRALTMRNGRTLRSGRPLYTPLMDFDIRSLHLLTIPTVRRSSRAMHVRRGREEDIPSIARFLDDDARRRPFGYVTGEADLRLRLTTWPGLTVDSFYLAEDSAGELRGIIALWDAQAVKRMVVQEYRGAMRRVRFAYDLAASVLGRARLPTPGNPFRYVYVTHQAVQGDDPRILRALLASAAGDLRNTNHHFISICAPQGSSVDTATRGFVKTNLAARLFVVTLPERRIDPMWFSDRPGFEMALV
jgi:hypothetical protein